MADYIDEEQVDNPGNTLQEKTFEEIIPTTDTESINQNIEIKKMEVHHHPDLHPCTKKV